MFRLFFLSTVSLGLVSGQTLSSGEKVADKKFIAMTAVVALATAFDAETTFHCIEVHHCREGNVIAAGPINAGRPAAYSFTFTVDALALYSAAEFKHRNSKLWWIFPVTIAGSHAILGARNLRFR